MTKAGPYTPTPRVAIVTAALCIAATCASCSSRAPGSQASPPAPAGAAATSASSTTGAPGATDGADSLDAAPSTQPAPTAGFEPMREFRGVWVATVANIDWPSRRDLGAEQQREELERLLTRVAEVGFNAVILQVRPAGDALYASEREPWSEYLTGVMGRPPEPFYDPLAFAIERAHALGLELHAWFNPFRARHASGSSPVASNHVIHTHPDAIVTYGNQLWMDPGRAEVRAHSLDVMLDVVQRYDVDGIHLDDYFYPYEIRDEQGAPVPFPDDASYAAYTAAGGTLARNDWRRSNIDEFMRTLYERVKATKPRVKVGISPFGIWRPGHPPQIEGYDAYDRLYADARKWLQEGWLDYLSPQLYWRIDPPQQSFPVLLSWWRAQNTLGRHIWPGIIPSRLAEEGERRWEVSEILRQIAITRKGQRDTGNVHFSARVLMDDALGLAEALASGPYAIPAVVPDMPWP